MPVTLNPDDVRRLQRRITAYCEARAGDNEDTP